MCDEIVLKGTANRDEKQMDADEAAIRKRFNQIRTAWTDKAYIHEESISDTHARVVHQIAM